MRGLMSIMLRFRGLGRRRDVLVRGLRGSLWVEFGVIVYDGGVIGNLGMIWFVAMYQDLS